ncbi:MAG TPA: hypothetical protein DDZ39_09630, partial [Flavobacteriaceae bacterium]|nr:hypothetical protein [Flavobacteriaceae bacterium]
RNNLQKVKHKICYNDSLRHSDVGINDITVLKVRKNGTTNFHDSKVRLHKILQGFLLHFVMPLLILVIIFSSIYIEPILV